MYTRRLLVSALLLASACSAGGNDSSPAGSQLSDDPGQAGSAGGGAGGGAAGTTGDADSGAIAVDANFDVNNGPCQDSIDLVFVLDMSSSMNFVMNKLSTEIDSVVAAANALAQQHGAKETHFGLVPFVDNHVLDLGGAAEGGKVHLDGVSLRAAFNYHVQTFMNANRNPGDGPNGPDTQNPICEENALDALYAAAVEFPWRDTATHLIVLATDDTFLERPDNYGDRDGDGLTDKQDFPREGDYPALRTVPETVEVLREKLIRVFTFTARGNATRQCGTPRRLPWEARAAGWSAPYWNNPPLPQSTDGLDYDLNLVRTGQLSLSATINEIVLNTHCAPPLY